MFYFLGAKSVTFIATVGLLQSFFFSASVIRIYGVKNCILFSIICYTSFTAANFYPSKNFYKYAIYVTV